MKCGTLVHFIYRRISCLGMGYAQSPETSLLHNSSNMRVTQKRISRDSVKRSYRLPCWIATMDAACSCRHGIKNGVCSYAAEFADTEISWAFIKAKAKVDAGDMAFQVIPMLDRKRDSFMIRGIEGVVILEKINEPALPCPSRRPHRLFSVSFYTSLWP
jgi:hypothetical protein